jgi:site-specific DNA-cytosine methylase
MHPAMQSHTYASDPKCDAVECSWAKVPGADSSFGSLLRQSMSHEMSCLVLDPAGNNMEVEKAVKKQGYRVRTTILNAQRFYLPQDRARLFWICIMGDRYCEHAGRKERGLAAEAVADGVLDNIVVCLDAIARNSAPISLREVLLSNEDLGKDGNEVAQAKKKARAEKESPKWKTLHQELYSAHGWRWSLADLDMLGDTLRESDIIRFVKLLGYEDCGDEDDEISFDVWCPRLL